MALGICSFALVSLASLMPMALDKARNALEIARGASVMQQVASELSQSHFSQVSALGQTPLERTFDYDGIRTTEAKEIYFTVTASVNPSILLPGTTQASDSMRRVAIKVNTPSGVCIGKTVMTIPDMGY